MPDQRDEPPRADDALREPFSRPGPPGKGPAETLLDSLVDAVSGIDEDAEDRYQRLLDEALVQRDRVAFEIPRKLAEANPRDYPRRWGLIHVACELRDPATLPLLADVVLEPIPPEESTDPHSFSTVAEETVLRTTAVEGVKRLAGEHKRAADDLWDFVQVDSVSIRRAAVQAILEVHGEGTDVRERLLRMLPEAQHFLLDLKRVEIGDVDQISDPQRHLSDEGREAEIEAPPPLPGRRRKGDAPQAESSE